MNDSDKVLTYEDAKQLCMKAFDGGVTYGSESMRYGVNARAYDWDHWLAKNERLFKPEPTVEDVLREFTERVRAALHTPETVDMHVIIAEYAAKLKLSDADA